MEYMIYAPFMGERAVDAEKIHANSASAAVRKWCEGRFSKDPEFASFVEGKDVAVTAPSNLFSSSYTVSVETPPPIFSSKRVDQ